MSDEPTVVDFGAAHVLSDAEVREWAVDQRVFISSVMSGMEKVRTTVAAAIEDLGAAAVWFEKFGGRMTSDGD